MYCPPGAGRIEHVDTHQLAIKVNRHLRLHHRRDTVARTVTILFEETEDDDQWLTGMLEWRSDERGKRPSFDWKEEGQKGT